MIMARTNKRKDMDAPEVEDPPDKQPKTNNEPKPTNHTNPLATEKPPSTPYYATVYKLESGRFMTFKSKDVAKAYWEENAEVIKDTQDFNTKTEYDSYMLIAKTTRQASTTNVKTERMSPEEQKALARITSHRQNNSKTKSINVRFKTTTFSNAVVVFIEARDQYGCHLWTFKPTDIIPTLQAYSADAIVKTSNTHTKQLINNMDYMERRDLTKGDNIPEKNNKGYAQHVIYTYFNLPETSNNTKETELAYITKELTASIHEIKAMLATNLFCNVLRECIKQYSTKLEEMTFNPDKGIGFQTFLNQANVGVTEIKSFTDHIIRDKVPILRRILSDNDRTEPKYAPTPFAPNFNLPKTDS